jgi:hypothetical protein
MNMKKRQPQPAAQPKPRIAGVTQQMIRQHACSLFRDVFPRQPLSKRQWRMVEEDLVRKLEMDGL